MASIRLVDYLTLIEENPFAKGIYNHINHALTIAAKHKTPWTLLTAIGNQPKLNDGEFMEYQRVETSMMRNPHYDRAFPLDTVEITAFNTKHHAKAQTAIIHTGPYADEYARSLNALAVTIANDIFFRNGAFKPETEQGRQIIAHELTHIAQHDEKRISKASDRQAY